MGTNSTKQEKFNVEEHGNDIPWYKLYSAHAKTLFAAENKEEKNFADENKEVDGEKEAERTLPEKRFLNDTEVAVECTEASPTKAKFEANDNLNELNEWIYVSKMVMSADASSGCLDNDIGYDITARVLSEEDIDTVEKVEMMLKKQNVVVHNVQISVNVPREVDPQVNQKQPELPELPELPDISESMLETCETPGTNDVTDETMVETLVDDLETTPGGELASAINPPSSRFKGRKGVKSSISFVISPIPSSMLTEEALKKHNEAMVECCRPQEISYGDDVTEYDVTEERQSVNACISFWESR